MAVEFDSALDDPLSNSTLFLTDFNLRYLEVYLGHQLLPEFTKYNPLWQNKEYNDDQSQYM